MGTLQWYQSNLDIDTSRLWVDLNTQQNHQHTIFGEDNWEYDFATPNVTHSSTIVAPTEEIGAVPHCEYLKTTQEHSLKASVLSTLKILAHHTINYYNTIKYSHMHEAHDMHLIHESI